MVIEDDIFRTPALLLPELFPTAVLADELRIGRADITSLHLYATGPASLPQRAPSVPTSLEIGHGIRLAGYDAQTVALESGKMLYVQLYWDAITTPSAAMDGFYPFACRGCCRQHDSGGWRR